MKHASRQNTLDRKMNEFEERLKERTGLTIREARAIIRDGIEAGLILEKALERANRLEEYKLAELIKEEYDATDTADG